MELVIKIPKEFEEHFNSDRFEDSLQRVRFDIHKGIVGNKGLLSWNYEIETLDMLTKAFLKATPLPKGHKDLIDRNELNKDLVANEWITDDDGGGLEEILDNAPTIIEADKEV